MIVEITLVIIGIVMGGSIVVIVERGKMRNRFRKRYGIVGRKD